MLKILLKMEPRYEYGIIPFSDIASPVNKARIRHIDAGTALDFLSEKNFIRLIFSETGDEIESVALLEHGRFFQEIRRRERINRILLYIAGLISGILTERSLEVFGLMGAAVRHLVTSLPQ
jgi:hypothetical protein